MINLGASFHITRSRECFSTYTAGDHGYVKKGDNGECKIVGVENVCLTDIDWLSVDLKGCLTRA